MLIVEDDRDLVDLLGLLLREMAGWEVESFTDPSQVLADPSLLGSVDLALVDLNMEPLGGPELVRRWRENGALPCPVVFLTGERPSSGDLALVDGAIKKPFTYQELMERLGAILGPRIST
ncbi:MAG: response regulator [Polyangia bacterium]|nr:response regulator [Polyangia bacterium]